MSDRDRGLSSTASFPLFSSPLFSSKPTAKVPRGPTRGEVGELLGAVKVRVASLGHDAHLKTGVSGDRDLDREALRLCDVDRRDVVQICRVAVHILAREETRGPVAVEDDLGRSMERGNDTSMRGQQ